MPTEHTSVCGCKQFVPRRRFGRTGISMPVITCGGMRFQHKWQEIPFEEVPHDSQANLEATLRRALDAGINHLETARLYGSSEMQLGRALSAFDRKDWIIQTKIPPHGDSAEFSHVFDHSLKQLCMESVDLMALHGINNEETYYNTFKKGGALDTAERLRAEGRCRSIGFSTHGPLDLILRCIRSGRFDYVNLHWYFVFQQNEPALIEAADHDMGVLIISPNDKGGKLYEPTQKWVDLCSPFSPMAFNDLFCLLRPEIHTLSCGAARPSDFDEHLMAAAKLAEPETAACIDKIAGGLYEEMKKVLGSEWVERWDEGLPEYYNIPREINVREIMRLWGLAKSLDMIAYGKMRYNLIGNGGHWFPGKNAAEAHGLDWKTLLCKNPFAGRIGDILAEAHGLLSDTPVERLSQSRD